MLHLFNELSDEFGDNTFERVLNFGSQGILAVLTDLGNALHLVKYEFIVLFELVDEFAYDSESVAPDSEFVGVLFLSSSTCLFVFYFAEFLLNLF